VGEEREGGEEWGGGRGVGRGERSGEGGEEWGGELFSYREITSVCLVKVYHLVYLYKLNDGLDDDRGKGELGHIR
jgi:hypothetical protein